MKNAAIIERAPVGRGIRGPNGTGGLFGSRSPSPRPSPVGRGRKLGHELGNRTHLALQTHSDAVMEKSAALRWHVGDAGYSLSLGKRVRVRGNVTVTRRSRRVSCEPQSHGRLRGFTLLEVLIAVAVFAIVLAAVNVILYGALRLRNRAVESIEQGLPRRQALAIFQHDLANLVVPGGVLSGDLQTSSITNLVGGQSSPDFYTTSGLIDETSPWAEIQK